MLMERLIEQRDRAIAIIEGIRPPETLTEIRHLVVDLAVQSYGHEYGRDNPHPYITHIGQVATVSGELLQHAQVETKRRGQLLSWTHDIGRSIDMGPNHPIIGARMLRALGFDDSVVLFSLAHHRWGVGEKSLANGNYPGKAKIALETGRVAVFLDESIQKHGIESLAVLLADNSKALLTPGSFEPTIVPFTEELGYTLIESQIARGRFERGGYRHGVEVTGMKFLVASIPFLEEKLDIHYTDVITRSRDLWVHDRAEIVALWNDIVYDHHASFDSGVSK